MITKKSSSGSALIEALVSVLIFFIGLIALTGLSSQSINMVGQSKARNDASLLASELIGEMWSNVATPQEFVDTNPQYANWISRVATDLPSGTATVTPNVDDTSVDIVISWVDKKTGANSQYVTRAEINRNR